MKYQITNTYEVEETTCGECVKKLVEAKGDIYCLGRFIDPDESDNPLWFNQCWHWIQAKHPSKKLLLVIEEISSEGKPI